MADNDEPKKEEAAESQPLEKFVRLKLTNEIVEVKQWASNKVTIMFKGQPITLRHDEVYHLPQSEQQVHSQRLNH